MQIKCSSLLEMIELIRQYHREHPDHEILPADSGTHFSGNYQPCFGYMADNGTEDCPQWLAPLSTSKSLVGTEYEKIFNGNGRTKLLAEFNGQIEFQIGNRTFFCKTAEKAIEEYNKIYEKCKQEYFTDDFSMTARYCREDE